MHAKIFSPTKTATQSGRGKAGRWVLQFEPQTKRQPESLMGWVSSNDTINQIKLKFDSCDRAIAYAERKGYTYDVIEPNQRKLVPKNYLQNFKIEFEERF